MARKKKAPAVHIVHLSLTEQDRAAKGTELANRVKQIKALKDQKAEENARFQKLIDEQIELMDAIASQLLEGTEPRDQASLKVGEDGELVVPDKPFAEVAPDSGTFPEVSEAERERIEAEKVAEGLRVPPAVADAIAKSGGEVDLSAAKAKNGKSKTAKTPDKKQPPKAPAQEPVSVLSKPTSCPDCGGPIAVVDDSGVYKCADLEALNCTWMCVVEPEGTTEALGPIGAHA